MDILFGECKVGMGRPSREVTAVQLATVGSTALRNFTMLWRSSDTPCGAQAQSSDCDCRSAAMQIGRASEATSKSLVGQYRAQRATQVAGSGVPVSCEDVNASHAEQSEVNAGGLAGAQHTAACSCDGPPSSERLNRSERGQPFEQQYRCGAPRRQCRELWSQASKPVSR